VRTRIDEATRDMWFVLERLEPMPIAALHAAGDALINGLTRLSPGARVTRGLIDKSCLTSPAIRVASGDSPATADHSR
jgi:DNA/RNA-binding domain of Phe-tRNA-synthetase-like protein